MSESPILSFPDFSCEFLLETDASGVGLGAILAQEQPDDTVRPIAFASRSLQPHEKNYPVTELEALGVVWSVKHFRHYLYGHTCRVYTDHEALKSLMNTLHPSGKLARWGLALQEVDLHIHYCPGKKNANADALSRCPMELDVQPFAIIASLQTVVDAKGGKELREKQLADGKLADVMQYLEHGVLPCDGKRARELTAMQSQFVVKDGVLFHLEPDKTLRVALLCSSRKPLFDTLHGGKFGGHL